MKIKYWFPSLILSSTLHAQEVPTSKKPTKTVKASEKAEKAAPSEVKKTHQAKKDQLKQEKKVLNDGKIELLEPPKLPDDGLGIGGALPPVDERNPLLPGLPDDFALPKILPLPLLPSQGDLPPPPPEVTKLKKDMPITAEKDLRYPALNIIKPLPLKGIMLIKDGRGGRIASNAAPIQPPQKSISGVFVSPALLNIPKPNELKKHLIETYIKDKQNPELTYGELETMVKEIHRHYIDNGFPLVHVYVPTQKVSDSIQIAILEGQIKPAVNGDKKKPKGEGVVDWWQNWYDKPYDTDELVEKINDKIDQESSLQPKGLEPIFKEANKSPWDRLNRKHKHPFLNISGSLTPYEKDGQVVLGQTQLNVITDQERPLKIFTGYDNSLTDLLGNHRFYTGAVWYDAFKLGKDHQLSFQLFTGTEPSAFAGFAAGYHIPWQSRELPAGERKHFTDFYASYVNTEAEVSVAGIPTTVGGSSIIFGGMHWYRLPNWVDGGELIPVDHSISRNVETGDRRFYRGAKKQRQTFGVFHEAGAGLDFKLTDNTLEFGGATVSNNDALISQLVLGYTARQTDSYGETNLRWRGYVGLGGTSETDMGLLRNGAKPNYFYTRLELDRETDLPYGMLVKNRLSAQFSTSNLLASEQLSLGGQSTIRGYAERAFRADNGVLFSSEIYSPAFHPLTKFTKMKNVSEELRFLAFFDAGMGSAVDKIVPTDESQTLMSAGVGLRYNFKDDVSIRADYGFPLKDLDNPPFDKDLSEPRVHIGAVWTF